MFPAINLEQNNIGFSERSLDALRKNTPKEGSFYKETDLAEKE